MGAFQRRRDRRRRRDQYFTKRPQPDAAKVKRERVGAEDASLRQRMGLAGAATAKLGEFWPEDGSRG